MQQNDNEQVKIDWSKAPEGATHYSPDSDGFYKIDDDDFMKFAAGSCEWVPSGYKYGQGKMDPTDIAFAKNLIERPKQETPDPQKNLICDWSIAPEEATHFCEENSNWYDVDDEERSVLYHLDGPIWKVSIHPYEDKSFIESLIPRPQETNTAPYIDWSKAPEGTTHVIVAGGWKISTDGIPEYASQWEKHEDGECYEYCDEYNEWKFFANTNKLTKEGMSWRIARPTCMESWNISNKPNKMDEGLALFNAALIKAERELQHDPVNNPKHYTSHPSGIDCIQVVEHMNFCIGNAIKYLWRADLKNDAIEDLKKARWYVDREIARRENME